MFLRNSKPRIWHSWYGTITLTNPDDEIKQEEVKSCLLNKNYLLAIHLENIET